MKCPYCHQSLMVSEEQFSEDVQCPNCSEVVTIADGPLGKGMVLGDFEIDAEIGSGGMATVYLARQISLNREVALKILHPELALNIEQVEGFVREAQVAAKLNHPGIVQIYSVGEEQGFYYFAMELVMGASVKEILEKTGKPELDWSLMVARKVTIALNHAWTEAELVHRDVKPDNIIIREDGAVKLADLGLAMSASALSESGDTIEGSPHYISPEALLGEPLDFRSDIYCLGATLYHMTTGEFPFVGDTLINTARMHLDAELVPPEQRSEDVPTKVSKVIEQMMAKDPNDRQQSLQDLADDLRPRRRKKSISVLYDSTKTKSKLPIYLMTGAALLILFIISAFLLNAYVQNKSTKDAKPVIIRAPVKRVKKMPVEKISNPETDKKPVKQTPVKKDE